MPTRNQQDKTFERVEFTPHAIDDTEFENCVFRGCDLSNFVVAGSDFVDCRFEGCNLSMFVPNHCGMKQVAFADSKLVGVDFTKCTEFAFSVSFARCNLDFARFMKMPLKSTRFDTCSLREAQFGEANLTNASFAECNLDRAVFHRTTLTGADLRTASNYAIDPETNRVAKAKFSRLGLAGLLGKYGLVID